MPTPIWLDCDTGHDDAFAILLAARHPDIQLLGISTVFGNASLDNTTYNTRAILKALGREDVAVYAGAAKPYCREALHAPGIHGESGLDGTSSLPVPVVPARNEQTAINAMYEALISTPKGTAWLVPIGAFTNAALLFAAHPDLAEHIGGLSLMGGAIGGAFTDARIGKADDPQERIGNITRWGEFNVYIDPESAKSLLSNPVLAGKTTLVTLDLTHLFLATTTVQETLLFGYDAPEERRKQPPSKVRQLFSEIIAFFAHTYAGVFGITAGPPVHDPLAVAAAFMPALFSDAPDSHERLRYVVEVITDGPHSTTSTKAECEASRCGRTIATLLPMKSGGAAAGVRIPRAVDAETTWQLIDLCLGLAEKDAG